MGMRDLNNVDGLLSCTYSEAIYKCKSGYNSLKGPANRAAIIATIACIFNRTALQVTKDLQKP